MKIIQYFFYILLFSVLTSPLLLGQDSLATYTFKELDKRSENAFKNGDIELSKTYAAYQRNKARKENDSLEIAKSFNIYTKGANWETALKYCDSVILYTKNLGDKDYPSYGYIQKARLLNQKGRFDESMKCLLTAYRIARGKNNRDQVRRTLNNIAHVKMYLEDYHGAMDIGRDLFATSSKIMDTIREFSNVSNKIMDLRRKSAKISDIIKDSTQQKKIHLSNMYNLSTGFMMLKKMDSARYYARLGREKAELEMHTSKYYNIRYYRFIAAYAKTDYHSGKYDSALDSLVKYEDKLYEYTYALEDILYYIGKLYGQKGNIQKATYYFNKVDSIIWTNQEPFPEAKDLYQTLAYYAKANHNDSLQMIHFDRYIWVDSLFEIRKYRARPLVTLKYDKAQILEEKQRLLDKVNNKNKYIYLSSSIAMFLFFIGIGLYFKQSVMKKKIKSLLDTGLQPEVAQKNGTDKIKLIVPEHIVSEIQDKLQKFEQSELVVDPCLNQTKLAEWMHTNSTYLSNYINYYKGKNFPSYLKELRIKMAVERLKNEPKLLRYTINGLALEFGFLSSGSFTKAFVNRTGVTPNQFLKELKK